MRTENLAVMLTDMKGFTAATSRQSRAENARLLALQDALLLPVVRAFGGGRVKTIGDAYLVLFASPTAGLLCGMALQDRLWDYNRRAPEEQRIEVRVVLSLGEVRLVGPPHRPTDVYGEAVNLASRVEAEAEAGEVWFTEAVRLVADSGEVPADEVGLRSLKGFLEPVRLFRAARAGSGLDEPPYGGFALARVTGLSPPEPARLERVVRRREWILYRTLSAVRDGAAGPALAAVVLAVAAGGGYAGYRWWYDQPQRLIGAGRYQEALAAIETRAAKLGPDEPSVLFLRGRLEQVRADGGAGGRLEVAFELFSRALAGGSPEALATLGVESRLPECHRRLLAARALADAGAEAARPLLEALARAEPPTGLLGFLPEPDRCGAGDVAREGLSSLREARGTGRTPTREAPGDTGETR
ncbi:MAG TPA: adenylate/guanylate cyclase domain-containing protein [Anaeromyxobacter sp.]|nr:adenylate/guanylate cyclase domain-containing protein [Anaeromyxobacter sp.]